MSKMALLARSLDTMTLAPLPPALSAASCHFLCMARAAALGCLGGTVFFLPGGFPGGTGLGVMVPFLGAAGLGRAVPAVGADASAEGATGAWGAAVAVPISPSRAGG